MNMLSTLFVKQARVLRALAHPKRLEIINMLRDQKLSVSQIQKMLALRQAYLSQHLTVLRKTGVVVGEKKGKEIYYHLAKKEYLEIADAVRKVLGEANNEDIKDLVPLVIDPVCRMRISVKTAGATAKYRGTKYYFCATGCAKNFLKEPQVYV